MTDNELLKKKREKLEHCIFPLLKCVQCQSGDLSLWKSEIKCLGCQEVYPILLETPIMTLQPAKVFDYTPREVLPREYPKHWYEVIKRAGDGLVMDFGSGNNPECVNNLIKFDRFALPHVEVVGDVETLPFKKESFHLIFSKGIFEQLPNPFLVADKFQEVLIDDGEIYVEAGFLGPQQNSPTHFFNMAKSGIEEVFSNFEKVDSGTQPHLYPGLTLLEILNAWGNKLTPQQRKEFFNTTVGEIQAEYTNNAFSTRWMENFSYQDREELASGVFFLGRKCRSDSRLHPLPYVKTPPRRSRGSSSQNCYETTSPPHFSRFDKVMSLIDKDGLGLEIGPSHQPIAPKKLGFNVHILDVGSAEELRTKFTALGVSVDEIEEVDFIWHGEPISELIGREGCYDWIIASHVIEHVPDMISFLNECEKLLKPTGVLSLVVPDKRYCFDYFQGTTSTGEILDAFDQKRTRPTPGKVFDFCARFVNSKGRSIWSPPEINTQFEFVHTLPGVKAHWDQARTTDDYFDVHNWRFTPSSFRLVIKDLRSLELTDFDIKREFDTTGCEFYVTLGKCRDSLPFEDSNRMELLRRVREDDEWFHNQFLSGTLPIISSCKVDINSEEFLSRKKKKLDLLASLLSNIEDCQRTALSFNFLTDKLRQSFNIIETDNVSAHEYDSIALGIIAEYETGLVLDCGSGKRSKYFDNVVNLEVVPYESTDVLAVGEVLPFVDECFDAVLCLNVLEHLKDPFLAANEILRVLKPGGRLYSVTPFLQPVHAFPHHYYNMTAQGLANLFGPGLKIDKQEVLASGLPIWGLSSILKNWAAGLKEETRENFLSLKVSDLMGNPVSYLNSPFVSELTTEKNFEIACTTALLGTKK